MRRKKGKSFRLKYQHLKKHGGKKIDLNCEGMAPRKIIREEQVHEASQRK